MPRILIVVIILMEISGSAQGFVKRQGNKIVDAEGKELIFPAAWDWAVGWSTEGYMLNTPGDWGPTKIDSGIVDLVGRANADIYWATYEANYVAEEDIAQIAAWGMNSIRLPLSL
jgi:endoglucanase